MSACAADNEVFSGAGVMPYTVHQGQLLFLFHKTHAGRKVGTLIDFGGATGEGETDAVTVAAREFIEETFACALDRNRSLSELKTIASGLTTEIALQQSPFVTNHIASFEKALRTAYSTTSNPNSHEIHADDSASWPLALRAEVAGMWENTFDRYYSFFVYLDWKPAEEMTELFSHLSSAPTSSDLTCKKALPVKKRTFLWVPVADLLRPNPDPPLYIRVANLANLTGYIKRIQAAMPSSS